LGPLTLLKEREGGGTGRRKEAKGKERGAGRSSAKKKTNSAKDNGLIGTEGKGSKKEKKSAPKEIFMACRPLGG